MEGNRLNKGTSIVLYRQLADELRRRFSEGDLLPGARIPTEFDLAAKYGVSRGTVRQALRLLQEEGLIERIPGAGTFIRGGTPPERPVHLRQIGLIVPHAHDQLLWDILRGVQSVARYRGFQVLFHYSNENPLEEKANIEQLLKDQVEGMIIFPVSNESYAEPIWDLRNKKIPFVLIDRYFTALDCDYVVSDNLGGGYRATEHLALLGYQKIGFVYHRHADFRTSSVNDRYRGYRKALADYHLDFQDDWLVEIDDRLAILEDVPDENSLKPYLDYLQAGDHPCAFFTVNDSTAISLVSAAARLEIKVPDDLAVVGFDNIKIATLLEHPLTTIHQERVELGVRAAQLLLGRIDGHVGKPEHVVIPTSLVVRETCGARQRAFQGQTEDQAKPEK